MNNEMPKIVFKKMTKAENIDLITWTFFEDNSPLSLYESTIQYFPELGTIDRKNSKEEISKTIEEVVGKYYNEYENQITLEVERYNNIWEKYNDKYFKTLCDYLDIAWPLDKKIIEASVGFIPVFPRYLDSFGFSICTGINEQKIVEISAHETLHFAWFLKWKELYPNCPRCEYDSSYLPWLYSKMVVDPILNSFEMQNLFKGLFEARAYDSFYTLENNGENVMDILKVIYNENININEKIANGYEYIESVYKEKSKK